MLGDPPSLRRPRRWLPALLLTALCLVLGACSSGGKDTRAPGSTQPTTTGAPATTVVPAPAPTSPVSSAGCGRPADAPTLTTRRPGDVALDFVRGDVARTYRLGVPTRYDPDRAAPLVVNLHGSGSNAIEASAYSDLPRTATGRGLLVVTPDALAGKCPRLPVIAFHGTADPIVAYGEGGGTVDASATPNAGLPGTLTNIGDWAAHNGCGPEPLTAHLGDDVERRSYGSCKDGADVVLYTILGGGHTWPGSDVIVGAPSLTTHTISATKLALDWFEAHPRGPDR